jgi:hypothetical protein
MEATTPGRANRPISSGIQSFACQDVAVDDEKIGFGRCRKAVLLRERRIAYTRNQTCKQEKLYPKGSHQLQSS